MSKSNILSIVLGGCVLIITIIMIFHVSNVAYEHSVHNDWSLGVKDAVKIILSMYSIIICLLSIGLVIINLKVKKKECK